MDYSSIVIFQFLRKYVILTCYNEDDWNSKILLKILLFTKSDHVGNAITCHSKGGGLLVAPFPFAFRSRNHNSHVKQ